MTRVTYFKLCKKSEKPCKLHMNTALCYTPCSCYQVLCQQCGFLLNYNKREILFGKIGNQFMAKSTIVLITKYYIYKNRCKNRALYFENLKKEICDYICIEKYISITNGKFFCI